jgi:hypothetical protein
MVYLRSRNEIKKFGGTGGIMGLFGCSLRQVLAIKPGR